MATTPSYLAKEGTGRSRIYKFMNSTANTLSYLAKNRTGLSRICNFHNRLLTNPSNVAKDWGLRTCADTLALIKLASAHIKMKDVPNPCIS